MTPTQPHAGPAETCPAANPWIQLNDDALRAAERIRQTDRPVMVNESPDLEAWSDDSPAPEAKTTRISLSTARPGGSSFTAFRDQAGDVVDIDLVLSHL
jgi:hypothetical protein